GRVQPPPMGPSNYHTCCMYGIVTTARTRQEEDNGRGQRKLAVAPPRTGERAPAGSGNAALPRRRERPTDRLRPRSAREREPMAQGRRTALVRLSLRRARLALRCAHDTAASGGRSLAAGRLRADRRRDREARPHRRDTRRQRYPRRLLPARHHAAAGADRPPRLDLVRRVWQL